MALLSIFCILDHSAAHVDRRQMVASAMVD